MARVDGSAVSIRFSGDGLDPAAVSAALGYGATVSYAKGETWSTPNGRPVIGRTGYWAISAERESPADVDRQVARLLEKLNGDLEVWRSLSARFGGSLFVGLFLSQPNEGLLIAAETIAALSARGLSVDLDIYDAEIETLAQSEPPELRRY